MSTRENIRLITRAPCITDDITVCINDDMGMQSA